MFRMIAAVLVFFATISLTIARADNPDPGNWQAVLKEARGQTVYWHAWGGEVRINDYIAWAGSRIAEDHGVKLVQVKVSDTANVVSRVLAEKAAGTLDGGSVDLVWINGENFAAMKRQNLLMQPGWANKLPNYSIVDVAGKPTVASDFTVATDGLEAPWGMAQLVFVHDTARLSSPPKSMAALAEWAAKNPGRFTYPQPPDFIGSTFLKQALYELAADPTLLGRPVAQADFMTVTAPLFAYLDKLHPVMWRKGRAFPQNKSALRTLLADGEVDIAFDFNPGSASSAIANGQLPDSVRTFVFEGGTIGNSHFVAIPFNANAKAGALVLANFLISAEAQARKQDPNIWGDPTVLNVAGLDAESRGLFEKLKLGIATLSPIELGAALPEPHPSWMTELEKSWVARYGAQ